MSKTLIVAKREYLQRVKSKGFIIFTILLPALIGAYILFIVSISRMGANQPMHLAVVDLSGQVFPELRQELTGKLPNGRPKYTLELLPATAASLPALERQLAGKVLSGAYTGYLVIPAGVLESRTAQYYSKNVVLEGSRLEPPLRDALTRIRLRQAGVAAAQMPGYFAAFDLKGMKVTPQGASEDQGQTMVLGFILGGLLYGALMAYGMTFMSSVVEEKTSRVAEVILSSVDAFGLLLGKIIGVSGAALTQACIWGFCLALAGAYSALASAATGQSWLHYVPHIAPIVYISFVIFFVLGFLVYASLFAAAGAIVSSEQEMRQTAMPITLLLVVAFVLSFSPAMMAGTSLKAVILSEVPFFAPILMMMRITVSNPPLWQVLLSFALCAITVLLIAKVTAKIYRVGILMTGKRPSLPELVRWLRYS